MFCTPPATTRSVVPLMTAWAAKCTACWDEPHWRSTVVPGTSSGRPGGQPRGAGDVAGLGADGVDAAEDDVLDGGRVDAGPVDEGVERVGAEVRGVHVGQAPAPAPHRRPDRIDDVGLSHVRGVLLFVGGNNSRKPGSIASNGSNVVRMTDEPWPKRPWLAVMPTRAPSTWRSPAWPRSCQVSSQTWAMAWAGMASPKQDRPPEVLTGMRPPMLVSPSRTSCSASPSLQRPEVLVPVELEGGGQVVDLGQVDVVGAEAGLLVGRGADGVPVGQLGGGGRRRRSRWRTRAGPSTVFG